MRKRSFVGFGLNLSKKFYSRRDLKPAAYLQSTAFVFGEISRWYNSLKDGSSCEVVLFGTRVNSSRGIIRSLCHLMNNCKTDNLGRYQCSPLEKQKDSTGQVLFVRPIFFGCHVPNAAKGRRRHTSSYRIKQL